MDVDGYRFPGSGLLVQVDPNALWWRLDAPETLAEQGPDEGWSPLPTRLLAGYSAKPVAAPGWVIATGRVPEHADLNAFANRDSSQGEIRPDLLGTRPPKEPSESEWAQATCCVLTGGFWATEIPFTSQWLRLIVNGESHTWFRPIRRLLR